MSTEPADRRSVLAANVQHNCDLADAHHAQAMSLCAYLLDMREYFRWNRGLPLGAMLERTQLSPWIAAREAVWETLRESDDAAYAGLGDSLGDDPFDEAAADAALADLGLAYGAGIGRFGRPVFCLAERRHSERRDGIEIVVAGRELARGLSAPPAVSRGGRVLIRLDAMERWLWAKYEEWQHHPHDHGFAAAWASYAAGPAPAGRDADPVGVVRAMARGEVETLVLHEIGEVRAGAELGDAWEEMLDAVIERPGSRRTELFVRSLRDLLADCQWTLPALLERDAAASLHFWFGNFDGMRRALAPALQQAYLAWCRGDRRPLEACVAAGSGHWLQACRQLLQRWHEGGEAAVEADSNTPDGYLQGQA